MDRIKRIQVIIIVVVAVAALGVCAFFSAVRLDAAAEQSAARVEHIFTHELVFDTEKAYAPTNKLRHCFDKDHLTAREFKRLLDGLYKNNYVLVSLDSAVGGRVSVPRGKKPITLSFDDMTYDTRNRGVIDKLVLDDGEIYDYTENDARQLTRERENVTILESFIAAHPDFSVDGARATLCVNGYNGILGYRITPDCRVGKNRIERDRKECAALVAELKRRGYSFASHTYSHRYFNSLSRADVERDCALWKKYIEPVVGKTNMLCFPSGEHNAKSDKMSVFGAYGFDVFLCVGDGETAFEKADGNKYIYRRPFDGTALRSYRKQYAHLVDTYDIYDTRRYREFSYKGGY